MIELRFFLGKQKIPFFVVVYFPGQRAWRVEATDSAAQGKFRAER
jgi:hypothetical protein